MRQAELDKIRKNREKARLVVLRRLSAERMAQFEADKKRWDEERAAFDAQMERHEEYSREMSMLTQMACTPFLSPWFYEDVKEKAKRLANEHGLNTDKQPSLKVVR